MRHPNKFIHDNLHLTCYIMERVGKEPGMSEALARLGQSNAFDRVDHQYLEAVFATDGFFPVFRITTFYSDICSVVKINRHLSGSIDITC